MAPWGLRPRYPRSASDSAIQIPKAVPKATDVQPEGGGDTVPTHSLLRCRIVGIHEVGPRLHTEQSLWGQGTGGCDPSRPRRPKCPLIADREPGSQCSR